jgi:Domain of unknown function (DUF4410)
MNRITKSIVLLFSIIALFACGSSIQVRKPLNLAVAGQSTARSYQIRNVKSENEDVPEHFMEMIKSNLKVELAKRHLLADENSDPEFYIDIAITNYRMRSDVARFMLGMFAGKDGVESTVSIRDSKTEELAGETDVSTFNITAIGSMDEIARMHAEEIAKFLAGGTTGSQ